MKTQIENDAIGKFWVVTRPTAISTIDDILFETSVEGMMKQTIGGLKPYDVVGIYTDAIVAKSDALTQLERRNEDAVNCEHGRPAAECRSLCFFSRGGENCRHVNASVHVGVR